MDHYQTLQVSPNASLEEIKKAFRKLALQYHPDRNRSPDASQRFQQIQQAWQVLKDRHARAAYNLRRSGVSGQQPIKPLAQNIHELLRETDSLKRKIQLLDPFRVDYDLLFYTLKDTLSEHNQQVFLSAKDADAQAQVFRNILGFLHWLPFPMLLLLRERLTLIAVVDPQYETALTETIRHARWQDYWNRYKIWFALAVAALFCLFLLLV